MSTTPLQSISILAPGNRGLNSENAGFLEDPAWALRLDNAVIDAAGRVSARKGWTEFSTSGVTITGDVEAIGEYVIDADNSKLFFSTSTQDIEMNISTGALIDRSGGFSNGSPCRYLNYNGKMIRIKDGTEPEVIDDTAAAPDNFAQVATGADVPEGGIGMAGFGRLWVVDATDSPGDSLLRFSALLDETDWSTSNNAGALDTREAWPDGNDVITAVSQVQGQLVIFGRRSVLIYSNPEDPSSTDFQLTDVIENAGCIDQNSVQQVGNDLIYLSNDGVRSLRRGLQFSTLPYQSLTDNVRSDIVDDIANLSTGTIQSFYSQKESLYGLKINSRYWAFDVRPLQSGDMKPSRWTRINWKSAAYASDDTLYLGQTAKLATYSGYTDDGSTYSFRYRSVWLAPAENRLFLPKRAKLTVVTQAAYNIVLRWAVDYVTQFTSQQVQLQGTTVSEWVPETTPTSARGPQDEWGTAEWSGGGVYVKQANYDLTNEGERWALEVAVNINGSEFAIQKIDLFGKVGRLAA